MPSLAEQTCTCHAQERGNELNLRTAVPSTMRSDQFVAMWVCRARPPVDVEFPGIQGTYVSIRRHERVALKSWIIAYLMAIYRKENVLRSLVCTITYFSKYRRLPLAVMFKIRFMVKPQLTSSVYKEILSKCPTLISYCIEALENPNPRMLQWWESSRHTLMFKYETGTQDKENQPLAGCGADRGTEWCHKDSVKLNEK